MICGNGGDAESRGESLELAALTALMGGGENTSQSMCDTSTAVNGDTAGPEQGGGSDMALQDWIMALDDITAPGDSQWLAQELLQGIKDFEAETNVNSLN